jgi:hypothetical protein
VAAIFRAMDEVWKDLAVPDDLRALGSIRGMCFGESKEVIELTIHAPPIGFGCPRSSPTRVLPCVSSSSALLLPPLTRLENITLDAFLSLFESSLACVIVKYEG